MGIKLVVSDIDGTLLNENHQLNQTTIDTIQNLKHSGYEFMLATGRNYESAAGIAKQLGFDPNAIPIISLNGARVDDPLHQYFVTEPAMDYETCKRMRDIGCQYYMAVLYCYEDHIYFHMDDRSMKDFELGGDARRMRFFNDDIAVTRIKDIEAIKHLFDNGVPILKMVYIQNPEYTELVKERISDAFGRDYSLLVVGPGWSEIMPKNVNKGRAMMNYAASRGIDADEIIAFGDSDNDLTMIEMAGLGVAMKNARNSLKILAQDIAESNSDDGVAKYIQSHLL